MTATVIWRPEPLTARLIAADTGYLDQLAAAALGKAALDETTGADGLRVADLAALPDPVRTRALHAWARSLGGSTCSSFASARSDVSSMPVTAPLVAVRRPIATATASSSSSSSRGTSTAISRPGARSSRP